MLLLELTLKSLRRRSLTALLTIASVAAAIVLLQGIESARKSARASLAGAVRGTDLLVGSRGGELQLLMYSVFHLGAPAGAIRHETHERWRKHPAVKWTIPISLGDSHRGFRVVGTNASFYRRYTHGRGRPLRFARGGPARRVFDVVLGSRVARSLGYDLNRRITLTHGLAKEGFLKHRDKPFRVVGILNPTGTPADRALYTTLEGIEALHTDRRGGGRPTAKTRNLTPRKITSFLLGTHSRFMTLRLQREINSYKAEPLTAIIPGTVLFRMWSALSVLETILFLISCLVFLSALISVFVSLQVSLNERRREIAVLRAMGARPIRVFCLLLLEAGLICSMGILLGIALLHTGLALAGPFIEIRWGLRPLSPDYAFGDWLMLLAVLFCGLLAGLGPAIRAYRISLHDGLTIKY